MPSRSPSNCRPCSTISFAPSRARPTCTRTPTSRCCYGLGIEINDSEYGTAYGHNGSVAGFKAEARYNSERRTSIVFLTNGEYRTDDADIVSQVADIVFKEPR